MSWFVNNRLKHDCVTSDLHDVSLGDPAMTAHELKGVVDELKGGVEQMRLQEQVLSSGAVILPPGQEISDPINSSYMYHL